MIYDDIVKFHGHSCPGTAIGFKVGEIVIDKFGRSKDEEIVAIVENNSCSIDAIQFMTGCTFGKGNLIFKDHGKHVYTFIDRRTRRSIRISLDKSVQELLDKFKTSREELPEKILEMSPYEIFTVKDVNVKPPKKASIYNSLRCAECKELVAEHRARIKNGKIVCIPCFKK
ncbi:MAG: formylmethanofuran dehydrogenase subunit [Methanobacteriaceae archaeon]|nr:formylmethanofuran dehydrogenase subunit [Methanobacteriaceae archaeon]